MSDDGVHLWKRRRIQLERNIAKDPTTTWAAKTKAVWAREATPRNMQSAYRHQRHFLSSVIALIRSPEVANAKKSAAEYPRAFCEKKIWWYETARTAAAATLAHRDRARRATQ